MLIGVLCSFGAALSAQEVFVGEWDVFPSGGDTLMYSFELHKKGDDCVMTVWRSDDETIGFSNENPLIAQMIITFTSKNMGLLKSAFDEKNEILFEFKFYDSSFLSASFSVYGASLTVKIISATELRITVNNQEFTAVYQPPVQTEQSNTVHSSHNKETTVQPKIDYKEFVGKYQNYIKAGSIIVFVQIIFLAVLNLCRKNRKMKND